MQKRDLKIIAPEKDCRYEVPGHPENVQRLEASLRHLKNLYPPETFLEPKSTVDDDILLVHRPALLSAVKSGEVLDPDTPGIPEIYAAALLSAGSAIQAAELCLPGPRVFDLIRPPGHHATPEQGMGFCYFNSVAIACQSLVKRSLAEKVAVLDIDCHHGNGTEAFFKGKASFLYVSLHQSPCYPGTGLASSGNSLNFPMPPGTEGPEFREALDQGLAAIRKFKPDLLGISAGFDTYVKDPLTQFGLQIPDYRLIGKDISEGVDVPQFAFLEGGYHEDLPRLIAQFLAGWTD